ncbi:MAG: glycosyltransferase family 2 protein [Candidatus Eisenbacteria bacterium]
MRERLPLSVLLLARDETRDLEELIPALHFAREVLVVWDEAGDPATREAAERLGARVVTRRLDGFGAQRQFGLEHCGEPWVLWLDADERLSEGSVATLARAIASGAPRAVVRALRTSFFLGRRIRFCGWSNEWLPRLFTRDGSRFDDASVHERIALEGGLTLTGLGRFEIEHHSYRDWDACRDKLVRYARAGAEQAFADGRRATAFDVFARPPLRFARQFGLQLGFLDGAHGLVLCALAAWQVGLKYAELWARSRTGKR